MASSSVGLLCLLVCSAGTKPKGPEPSEGTNVLLITVDTLRADHLGCYGYSAASTPVIDKLAAQGFRFTKAYAQVPLTLPSHYCILTGTYPFYHGVRDNSRGNPEGPPLVSEVLKKAGYRTGAFVGSAMLDSRFGLNRGFDDYFDHFDVSRSGGVDFSHIERPAGDVVRSAIQWIGSGRGKFFAWIHLFDPHDPYSPPEPFKTRFARSPYDGEIAYVDQAIGMLVDFLKEKGQFANTDIIFTGDHGEGLGDHGEFTHGFFIYEPTIHVPLIIRVANSAPAGKAIDHLVQSVDIAPTILRLARLQVGADMQGESLLGLLDESEHSEAGEASTGNHSIYFETFYPLKEFGWSELLGIRMGRHKYIEAPRPELYDLSADPDERRNLYSSHTALAAHFKEMLRSEVAKYAQAQRNTPATTPDPTTVDLLRSLGYVGYVGGLKLQLASRTGPRPDPKDKIDVYINILHALSLANEGQSPAAARILEEVLRDDPEVTSARLILGVQYEKMGKLESAAQQFARSLSDEPDSALAAFNLAQVLEQLGKVDDAIPMYQRVLKIDPTFSPGHTALGVIYRKRRQLPEALGVFVKALELGPNFTARYNLAGIQALEGQLDRALENAREAVTLQPSLPESYNILGSVYYLRNEMPQAERAFLKVLDLHPQSDAALTNLAEVYAQTGRAQLARVTLRRALAINPKQEAARRLLAQLIGK